jgi:hypothetical protein
LRGWHLRGSESPASGWAYLARTLQSPERTSSRPRRATPERRGLSVLML